MTWDLPGGTEHPSLVVPSGCPNLIVGGGGPPRITGGRHEVFHYSVKGRGLAVGVLFSVGGFFPYYGRPLSGFTDGVITVEEAFSGRGTDLAEKIFAAKDLDLYSQILDEFFLNEHPAADYDDFPLVKEASAQIVEREDIHSIQQLVDHVGINERRLQRLFDKYVGVSPKMLIRTKRFQTAIKSMMTGVPIDWADLALRLGYFDQSHFINDFKKITGRSPGDIKVANI